MGLPGWFASIVHVPAPVSATCEPLALPSSWQTDADADAIVSTTGSPDVAAAVTV